MIELLREKTQAHRLIRSDRLTENSGHPYGPPINEYACVFRIYCETLALGYTRVEFDHAIGAGRTSYFSKLLSQPNLPALHIARRMARALGMTVKEVYYGRKYWEKPRIETDIQAIFESFYPESSLHLIRLPEAYVQDKECA